jgi:hypothetical protein
MDKRFNVIISDRAVEMFVQHARFLTQVSPKAADKLRTDIIEAATALRKFSERGPWLVDPLFPANKYRKLLVDKRYLMVYQIKDETVYIDYVVDCRQNYGWLI